LHASRGLALAALGRRSEALKETLWLERELDQDRRIQDGFINEGRALVFAQAGLVDSALAALEPLLGGPSWTSVHEVRLDARYDPVRTDPRFQALLARYLDSARTR
jgi:hypothetical protein